MPFNGLKIIIQKTKNHIGSLVYDADRIHGINHILKFEDISDNTPITKAMLKKLLNM